MEENLGKKISELRRSERVKKRTVQKAGGEEVNTGDHLQARENTKARSMSHVEEQTNDFPKCLTPSNDEMNGSNLRSKSVTSLCKSPDSVKNKSSSVKTKCSSKTSKKSETVRLNLELKKLQQEKQFEEEERKLLQKRRETELKMIEIEKQLAEQELESEDEFVSLEEQDLYQNEHYVRKWVDDVNPERRECSNSNFVVGGIKGDTDFLTQIANQCVQNATNTHTLLLRQKMSDLMSFGGEITEWPLFFSEFKRTTELYKLTDYDNLLRLERALKGRARETVKALFTTAENVPQIIKTLQINFGRSDWIILSLMDKVKRFSVLKEDNVEESISFLNALSNMVITIKNANTQYCLFNPEMLQNIVEKLPSVQKYNWGKLKYEYDIKGKTVSLEDFVDWYRTEVGALTSISNPLQKSKNPRKQPVMSLKQNNYQNEKCALCKNHHDIKQCKLFLDKPTEERRKTVLSLKLCFLCLQEGHIFKRCYKKTARCGESGCKGRHHRLLHLERTSDDTTETSEPGNSSTVASTSTSNVCTNVTNTSEKVVLLRIGPVVLRSVSQEINVYALFDEGSTCTLIEEGLASRLKVQGPQVPLCYQWTNEITHYEDSSQMVSFQIAANVNKVSKFHHLRNVRTVKNLRLPNQKFDAVAVAHQFPHLDLNIFKHLEEAKPQLLIGQDNCGLIVPRRVIQPRLDQPILSYAKLGWTVHGIIGENANNNETSHVYLCCSHSSDEDLHIMVKNSFKLENFGLKTVGGVKSVEDKRAIEIMENTLKYIGNRFEIGHLYKRNDVTFPDSKGNALKRLMCMERKMEKDKEFAKQYCAKIEDYLKKGYATKVQKEQVVEGPRDWYLPHFAVWKNKPGQIRLVFDAAAKSYGYCINDFLYQGPDLVPPLIAVLWRFRQGRIAFGGDIKEMFHQVVIREQDRCSQRFFWRGGNKNEQPDIYQMNAMIFGAVSSPSKAQFVKNKNAERFQTEFPNIMRAITKQHYVDDYLDSCGNENDAIQLVHQVIQVHQAGGFEMQKWISNSDLVIKSIPEHLRGSLSELNIDKERMERVLGLFWSPITDEFIFNLNFKKIPKRLTDGLKVPTKREVLRIIMSVFDPLGFLAPLIVKARILMQDVWRQHVDWDTEIPENLFQIWKEWLEDLKSNTPVKINRCYFSKPPPNNQVDLHIFSDASDKAYAVAAYLRFEDEEEVFTSFVSSKFKVAPIAQQTVPKLELQGALLACRLAKTISSEIDFATQDIYFWTDSLVVLKQLRSECRRFPMFVGCRVGEIQESSDLKQWKWVPSEQNIADLATKVTSGLDLSPSSKWFSGPDFLKLSKEFWPKEPSYNIEDCCAISGQTEVPALLDIDVSKFSKYLRLLRTTAWILHFRNMLKLKKHERNPELLLDLFTLDAARMLLIRKCQWESFQKEIMELKYSNQVKKTSRLYKLSPFLDEDRIIRLKGRFPESNKLNLSYDTRYPIILDNKHRFTKLLMDRYHVQAGHVGVDTVISNIRQTYWILHIRSAVKKCFKDCQGCRIRKAKPFIPEMGLLPPERLEPFVFPFSYVGIDYFGPMTVAVGRRNEKRYGVLFTCLTVRAVHIEIAASLDTSSAILAIRRFTARRGQPLEIFTDNGTNFVGAEKELREYVQNFDNIRITDTLSSQGINWRFNSPAAPNMGGVWERMVRSIKTALKVTLKTVHPREEVLQTLLAEAEFTVNSRPLTHIPVEPNEMAPLTPNHFLLLRPGKVAYEEIPTDIKSRKQWRFAEALANAFWKRWVLEFRPTLLGRQKWHETTKNLKPGDMVLIVDEKAPRNEWLMGRIVEVFPGKDGVVRIASVETKKGSYVRPVSKLCLLPTDGEESKSSRGG